MTDPVSVTLAGKSFPVSRPLTLQQLCDVRVIVLDEPPQLPEKGGLRGEDLANITVHKAHVVATGITDPEMTKDTIMHMPCSEQELQEAYVTVLHLAGLKLAGEEVPTPGEAKPAA